MRIVYLDAIFVKNALLDYCVLLAAAAVGGVPMRRRRLLGWALLGGGYGALAALMGGAAASPGAAALVGLSSGAALFRREACPGRMVALLAAVSCGFAGAASFGLWLGCGLFLAAARLPLAGALRHRARGEIVPVTVRHRGAEARFYALVDTGNALRDPETGAPVTVCEQACLEGLRLGDGFALPIRTASGAGVLVGYRPECVIIAGRRMEKPVLAVARGLIGSGRGYAALTCAEAV